MAFGCWEWGKSISPLFYTSFICSFEKYKLFTYPSTYIIEIHFKTIVGVKCYAILLVKGGQSKFCAFIVTENAMLCDVNLTQLILTTLH